MKIVDAHGVYSFVLNELEWYGVTEEGRKSTIELCKANAEGATAKYANIMVEPDAILSQSPNPKRHIVWRHTFPEKEDQPVAYRVKDFADGWILCHTLEQAKREASAGNLIQALFL